MHLNLRIYLVLIETLVRLSKADDLSTGLQNYWTFDNHTNDINSNANFFHSENASFVPDAYGNSNSALYLHYGSLEAPAGVYFSGDHTVAVWIKLIASASWAMIFDFGNGQASDNIILRASYGTDGSPASTVYSSSSMNQYATSKLRLQLNKWTHLAHTFSNSTCKIYLNGTLTDTAGCLAPRAVTRSNCYLGKSNWLGNANLNAYLDELRVYNRSLNESEINQLVGYAQSGYTTTTTTTTTTSTSSTSTTPKTTTSSINSSYTSISSLAITSTKLSFINGFNFAQINDSQMIYLLNSNYDLNGCIVNCSNNGQCEFDSLINNFICSCNSIYLSGYACQIDTRPCSSNPCLNNATCVDYSNSSFSCVCDKYHSGAYCESEIDICQNETCSNNGNCFNLENKPKCKCVSMYSGEKCEFESNELKTTKQIISYSTIVAIVIIVLFYGSFVLMDATKYSCKQNKIPLNQQKNKDMVLKYSYIS